MYAMEQETREVLESYPRERPYLLRILQAVQERYGYLSEEVMRDVAAHVKISPGQVYGVATFYNQFRFIPYGKHHAVVCLGTACHAMGGQLLLDAFERELDISAGEITEDHEWSLDRVGCIGCCTKAPVVVVNKGIHAKMRPFHVEEILAASGWQKPDTSEEDDGNNAGGSTPHDEPAE